jgi:hypothetical protein
MSMKWNENHDTRPKHINHDMRKTGTLSKQVIK